MTTHILLIVLCVSALWIFNGLIIKKIRNWYATEVQFALLAGVLAGPVSGLIPVSSLGDTTTLMEWACRITMALALSSAALQMDRAFLSRQKRALAIIVILGMILMAASTTVVLQLVLSVGWAAAFLLGWILTPTDPVVTSTVVRGEQAQKILPASMRKAITYESGINDGLASPMVMLALSIWLSLHSGPPLDTMHWLLKTVGYENVLAAIIAYVLGYIAGRILEKAHNAGLMSESTILPFSLAFTLLILAGLHLLKMNEIVGVFIANLGLSHTVTENEDLKQEEIQSTLERLFTVPVFFLLGLLLPWQEWVNMGWLVVVAAVLVVVLRRLPAFLLIKPLLGDFRPTPAAAWIGWIGPIGVAALLYALQAHKEGGFEIAWPIVTLVVVASVIIHGSTSLLTAKLYSKAASKNSDEKK
ncbi:cation:proton antiporter domain-containing protein [Phytohalomonas tamaricis]|uniref:cation:proton antiporter domain-containing protein n=1 Tax=Phytohalomonas tamaricis TaxID=2081032 RepID=UPI000D0AF445|nr:cation:proton antiporter [Phytohalomonas tamaricis]